MSFQFPVSRFQFVRRSGARTSEVRRRRSGVHAPSPTRERSRGAGNWQLATGNWQPGFTLLEVMVAVALLSIGIVVLLQVQARSIQLAQQARNMAVATGLARAKLYDCEADFRKKGFSIGDYKENGRFDDEGEDGFESFFWECHAYKPELPVPDATEITTGLTQAAEAKSQEQAAATGQLGGLAGAGEAAGMGAGMLAPVLGQVSQVVGESIREMVVIVRWQEGESWEQLQVTTHLVDKTGINQMAAGLQQMGNLGGMLGGNTGTEGAPGGSEPPRQEGRK